MTYLEGLAWCSKYLTAVMVWALMLGVNEQYENFQPASVPDTARAREAWPCSYHLSFPWPKGGWLWVDRDQ